MKKFLRFGLLGIAFLFSTPSLRADSPLTSTPFYEAYQTHKIIRLALESEGTLTPKLMKYLCHPRKPLALKLALINALGWDFDGKHNADLFYAYLEKRNKVKQLETPNPTLQICYAYLKAMDNYFEVDQALEYANRARDNSRSYAVHLVASLIEAQQKMETDWCGTYLATDRVRRNTQLNQDISPEANAIIFKYMALYASSCTQE